MPPSLDKHTRVGVLGAGAMGSGIAQVAALAGHDVVVADSHAIAIEKAHKSVHANLTRDVEKKRLTSAEAKAAEERMRFVTSAGDDVGAFRNCGLVIEAIVEDLAIKRRAFAAIDAAVSADCVLASNTSSLSVTAIAAGRTNVGRFIGLHFFNPATVLPLVEVVGALTSDASVVASARALVDTWGKVTVLTADTPGFIVNRVARPYYGESLRMLEEGIADAVTIDWAMKEIGGFKMGPFELMDLIGNDVNYAVTKSVFEALGYDPRYRPSVIQRRMVDAGRLGKKSGAGYYDYSADAGKPMPAADSRIGQLIVDRVVAMLINEAADALLFKIASRDDIDLAMKRGMNYPRGLLAWADDIGISVVHDRLAALQSEYGEDRYRPSALLKRLANAGARFYPA
ncbi:MAG: 3-hydroxyacyl-CoA dehydrogenase NAD-binding domain-containing protein [Gemmatimonadota bacterium]